MSSYLRPGPPPRVYTHIVVLGPARAVFCVREGKGEEDLMDTDALLRGTCEICALSTQKGHKETLDRLIVSHFDDS